MKALEDLNYPHSRFAKTGGVSESELARLEISFCFLANFELHINEEALADHATALKEMSQLGQGQSQRVGVAAPSKPLNSSRRRKNETMGLGRTGFEVTGDA